MAKLHEQVSAIGALDDVLDGTPRAAPRKPRKAAVPAPVVGWSPFCRRCKFRSDDPQVMHRHMAKDIKELQAELGRFEAEEALLADLLSTRPRTRFTAKQIEFLRVNQHLSMSELATLLGRSPSSIKMARYRMRKAEGGHLWPPSWEARIGNAPTRKTTPKTLTPQDRDQILRLSAERCSGYEIGRRMNLSPRTVYSVIRKHRSAER